jgi:hypothetical protein
MEEDISLCYPCFRHLCGEHFDPGSKYTIKAGNKHSAVGRIYFDRGSFGRKAFVQGGKIK